MATTPYFPPSYFSDAYFGEFFQAPPPPPPLDPEPEADGAVETVAFRMIVDKLRATLAFGDVTLCGSQEAVDRLGLSPPSAAVVPRGWEESDDFDPDLALRTVEFEIAITVSDTTPQLRVEELNRLARIVAGVLRGAALGGRSVPALTRILKGGFPEKNRHPENEIRLKGRFAYLTASSV